MRPPPPFHTVRLAPGSEIKSFLVNYAKDRLAEDGGFVATCVGSVKAGALRLAHATAENRNEVVEVKGCHEITSLVGTLSADGVHLHATLSDDKGSCIGGHVMRLEVFTTAEIVIGRTRGQVLRREHDDATGFKELSVRRRRPPMMGHRPLRMLALTAAIAVLSFACGVLFQQQQQQWGGEGR